MARNSTLAGAVVVVVGGEFGNALSPVRGGVGREAGEMVRQLDGRGPHDPPGGDVDRRVTPREPAPHPEPGRGGEPLRVRVYATDGVQVRESQLDVDMEG